MWQTFARRGFGQPVIRSLRVGSVDWSIMVRPGAGGDTFDCSGVSLDGHVLRTRSHGASRKDVEDAVTNARTVEWVDLRGRTWRFTLDPGTEAGDPAVVHVDLDDARVGSVSVPAPITLAALGADRLFELLFFIGGQRRVWPESDGLTIQAAPA